MSTPGMQVTIFPTHVRVPNGLGSFKNVSLVDFYNEISRVMAGEEQTSQPKLSLRLPNETLSMRYNMHEIELLMYFPEARREIRYGPNKFSVPFPATVVTVLLKSNGKGGWSVERVKWLCTSYSEDEVPNIANWEFAPRQYSNRLWTLPLPNQYGDGNMCVGRNSYRSLYTNDLRGLNELYHHILVASPFNNDLWHVGSNGLNTDGGDALGWFRILAAADTFPWHRMRGYPQPTTVNVEVASDENYAIPGDEDEDED